MNWMDFMSGFCLGTGFGCTVLILAKWYLVDAS